MIEVESSLTDRYQTTVPAAIRRALRLHKRDAILYRVGDDGSVTISRKPDADDWEALLAEATNAAAEFQGLAARLAP